MRHYRTNQGKRYRTIRHGSATTTEAVRQRYNIVAEPKGAGQALRHRYEDRGKVEEAVLGSRSADRSKKPKSTVLWIEEKAIIAATGRFPLCAAGNFPHLSRSSLHRAYSAMASAGCRMSRGTAEEAEVQELPDRLFHIDIAEVQTAEGRLYLFVAIDQTSEFAYADSMRRLARSPQHQPSRNLIATVPYAIRTVLTDNSIQSTNQARHRSAPVHISTASVASTASSTAHQIEHPWTNGQVERMNQTIKEATVERFHYDDHDQLHRHLARLRPGLRFRPKAEDPEEPHAITKPRLQMLDERAEKFTLDPVRQMPGFNPGPVAGLQEAKIRCRSGRQAQAARDFAKAPKEAVGRDGSSSTSSLDSLRFGRGARSPRVDRRAVRAAPDRAPQARRRSIYRSISVSHSPAGLRDARAAFSHERDLPAVRRRRRHAVSNNTTAAAPPAMKVIMRPWKNEMTDTR